ncbi:MAG: hypothetical protein LUC37_04660 [Prevotella sp.]|nr:hypothetical protein [Prevotella sp.]
MNDKRHLKGQFIEAFKLAGGIVQPALDAVKISRVTYLNWRNADSDFDRACEEIKEAQIDFVENKLMGNINNGDTTAMIYYLKTMGRKRGWNEHSNFYKEVSGPKANDIPALEAKEVKQNDIQKRIENKKRYYIKLLKDQKKYSKAFAPQVELLAKLVVRTEMLGEEIFDSSHEAVSIEYSREGNKREIISAKEKLYLDYSQQCQRALRALGMNVDAREMKPDEDGFTNFYSVMNKKMEHE